MTAARIAGTSSLSAHIGPMVMHGAERRGDVVGLGDHLDVTLSSQRQAQTVAHELMVVGHDHTDRHSSCPGDIRHESQMGLHSVDDGRRLPVSPPCKRVGVLRRSTERDHDSLPTRAGNDRP